MEVITSHANADFDTFASMLAASKLYPGAVAVFSGAAEKKLRDAIDEGRMPASPPLARLKDVDFESVTRLILVDVRDAARIGPFGALVGRPGVDLHVYDHHPAPPGGARASVEEVRRCGSTATVLTHIMKEKGVALSPAEATVLMAGIYEDTGSLSYPSTTTLDYDAARFLLEAGADLSVVSDLLSRELTGAEVELLNDLIHSETVYTTGGLDVVVAEARLEKYSGDVSVLAHKLRDIERTRCLFVLVDAGDRVHVIGRSSAPEADCGRILAELGGGGHPSAASATLKELTLFQVRELLVRSLRANVAPAKRAADIMSFPPITVAPAAPLDEALTLMRRYNINAMPVVTEKNGGLAGVITRQVVDKAVFHGLGPTPVSGCMTTGCEWVGPDAPAEEIREKLLARGQRLIPVVKGRKTVGVITRTDLLKLMQEELKARPGGLAAPPRRRVTGLMRERIPGWLLDILLDAGRTASRLGFKAYVVGGFTRDLLMRRDNLDVDMVVEGGDAIAFANEFARTRGLKVKSHQRFKTAVVIFPDGYRMDVATARLEYYERPGSLPTVEASSLKLDLYRRDFTINTLAAAVNPEEFGLLVDYFGAERDIKDRTLRVLHNLSFIEDPTRALRAARFSEKFGFKIEKHTLNLMKNAVKLGVFGRVSGPRILDELKHILEEEGAARCVARLHELGLLEQIDKSLAWDRRRQEFFEGAREAVAWHRLLFTKDRIEEWLVLFLALTDQLTEPQLGELSARLAITGRRRVEAVMSRARALKALGRINAGMAREKSALYGLLKGLPLEALIYIMAKAGKEESKKAVSLYITRLKDARPHLTGDDLKRMGVKEGPGMGRLLKTLLERTLDGELTTREEEEDFVRREMKPAGRARR